MNKIFAPLGITVALLTGYFWLIVGGIVWITTAGAVGTPYYDVVIHTIFIGFAFTMIMAHAPVIFPAVMSVPVPYRPIMYVPLVLLNLGLFARVFGEIFAGQGTIWVLGGQLNVIAILIFLLTVIGTVAKGEPKKKPRAGKQSVNAAVAANGAATKASVDESYEDQPADSA